MNHLDMIVRNLLACLAYICVCDQMVHKSADIIVVTKEFNKFTATLLIYWLLDTSLSSSRTALFIFIIKGN